MKEKELANRIRTEVSRGPVRLFQNVVGLAYVRRGSSTYEPLRVGLGVGTSDLIGLVSVTVTPDMVGKKFAQFLAVEVKTETGRIRPEQQRFIDAVNELGGRAFVARSVQEVRDGIEA